MPANMLDAFVMLVTGRATWGFYLEELATVPVSPVLEALIYVAVIAGALYVTALEVMRVFRQS